MPETRGDGGPVRPLVFLHIPKTAGSTLRAILRAAYDGYPQLFLQDDRDEIAAFAGRPAGERRRYALLAAHVPWGGQALIPGGRPMTMLRDPVERFLSIYYYTKREPNALHYRTINENDLSLADVIERELFVGEYNLMTSMLRDPRAEGAGASLDSAKRNLAACKVFGLAERFEESIAHFTDVLRWPPATWEDRNVTKGRPKAEEIDPGVLDLIRHHTGVDRLLYEFARELFEQRLEAGGR